MTLIVKNDGKVIAKHSGTRQEIIEEFPDMPDKVQGLILDAEIREFAMLHYSEEDDMYYVIKFKE
jgi:hypothetical protein